MSKKRGLSLEEKREKVLEIFHESKDVFQLKDIEKLAPKKGVISQSVKEVLQSLVDDDMVHQDKIGISNFFWAFPSEASVQADRVAKLSDVAKHEKELHDIQNQLDQYAENDPDKMKSMEEAAGIAQDAANRWQDNIEALHDWCKRRFDGMGEQLEGFFKENGYNENMETFA
ncbi:TPA: Meiotic nuclear division protein 1 [Trebouxia sp. C0005]